MWYMTEVADWWDRSRTQSELMLDQFVERNPNQFGIIVATALHTSMVVGSGVVDVLRLGDGIAQGGWRGVGADTLRLLGVVGPAGKAMQLAASVKNVRLAKLIADVPGGRCSWVASTQALVATGQKIGGKLFARVEDLAGAVGVPWGAVGGVKNLSVVAQNLRSIGASVGAAKPVQSMSNVAWELPRDGSVGLIAVKLKKNGQIVAGHCMAVFFDSFGRLRILDRSGTYLSLADVAKRYRVDQFVLSEFLVVENVYAKFVGPKGGVTLVMQVLGVNVSEKKR